ncbi:hypothetical protein MMYC01_202798 [Madurella mycetomatis]|uniref:Uncharacterized protein n=1 Tax=Madurella mycetomatis TaxID=100816 RepID=A0A175WC72_9PEZI|nr:hypothetical protein MMYC01_202798 [Madurella mycetomatis]
MTRLIRAVWFICFSKICLAQSQCFLPNGKLSPGDFPCDPDAEESMCCGGEPGTACLSNKLCSGPSARPAQGACTDKFFLSPECDSYCPTPISSAGRRDLISCANVTGTDTSYCCGEHPDSCCDSGVGRFDALPSEPEVWAIWDMSLSRFVVVNNDARPLKTPSPFSLPTKTSSTSSAGTTPTAAPQSTIVTGTAAQARTATAAAMSALLIAGVLWIL